MNIQSTNHPTNQTKETNMNTATYNQAYMGKQFRTYVDITDSDESGGTFISKLYTPTTRIEAGDTVRITDGRTGTATEIVTDPDNRREQIWIGVRVNHLNVRFYNPAELTKL